MSNTSLFFSDIAAYRAWIRTMPGIIPCCDTEGSETITEGPYFVSPQVLLLRVGRSYAALHRVSCEQEADFRWYVPSESSPQNGIVYAAYLRDTRRMPAQVIGGETLAQARVAVQEYLVGQVRDGKDNSVFPVLI